MVADESKDAGRGASGGGGFEWVSSRVVRFEDLFFACELEVAVALKSGRLGVGGRGAVLVVGCVVLWAGLKGGVIVVRAGVVVRVVIVVGAVY